MKTVDFKYGPHTLHLYCNGSAMFALQDLDPDAADQPDPLTVMLENTAAGYEMIAKVAHILTEQGELCRRYLGYPEERIPEAKELLLLLSPVQMVALRTACYEAIAGGYNAADEGDGDIDTGLMELEGKKKMSEAQYLQMAAVVGVPPRDALMLLTPTVLYEMFDRWSSAHGVKKEAD